MLTRRAQVTLAVILVWMVFLLGGVLTAQTVKIVDNRAACADNSTGGTEAMPYCTLRYISTIWRPGDTFEMRSRRDGSGPDSFTRGGTSVASVTIRGINRPVIGAFYDLPDEQLAPTAVPNVYSLTTAVAGQLHQTFYPPEGVHDPNGVDYDMVDTDGPLNLARAPDDATLARVPGTYIYSGGILRIHPFGDRVPSTTATDFVIGLGRSMNIASGVNYLTFEGFLATYHGSVYSWQIFGAGHVFRDMQWVGVPPQIKGRATFENFSVAHVHQRDASGGFRWDYRGMGTAVQVTGTSTGIQFINGHVFHSWNANIQVENPNGALIDGVRVHGAPNHCSANGPNTTLRNAVFYNCQDAFYVRGPMANFVMEHVTAPSGIAIESIVGAVERITVRNSVLTGSFSVPSKSTPALCRWETGSLLENSVVHASATIERCNGQVLPILTYQARCAAGQLVDANGVPNCMTIRNIRTVTDWSTVLTGGMWSDGRGDTWDATPVAGGPAIDCGSSNTPTDIIGMLRPQAASSDAGAYEVEACGCPQFRRRPKM